MKGKLLFCLVIIFILGVFLRFYKLSEIPPGLYVDEAAIGYNAFSLLENGKDEYGVSFPLLFRSFGDYKMPGYIYFSTIPIWVFSLSLFSVRFLSALAGSFSVLLIFFLMQELFGKKEKLSLLASLFFAISPWSIFFSRAAFESNLGLFFFLGGIYFWVRYSKGNSWRIVFSFLFLILSSFTYHSFRLIIPILFAVIFLKLFKDLWEKKIKFVSSFFLSFLFFVILEGFQVFIFLSPQGNVRFHELSILSKDYGSFLGLLQELLSQYFAYFSPRNLFFLPDSDLQRSLPNLSVFYSWMVAPYFFGLWFLFKSWKNFWAKIIVFLLFISPLPACVTGDPFSTLRAETLLIPSTIVIALGSYYLLCLIKNKFLKYLIFSFFILISLASFYRSYFILFPHERFSNWSYGYDLLVEKLVDYRDQKVLIMAGSKPSYINLLFFMKYNASQYQKQNIQVEEKWEENFDFGNIEVRGINWEEDIYKDQILIAGPLGVSEGQTKEHFFEKIFTINGPNGEVIFNGFKTHPDLKIKDDLIKLKQL